jgi:hypothetical protein
MYPRLSFHDRSLVVLVVMAALAVISFISMTTTNAFTIINTSSHQHVSTKHGKKQNSTTELHSMSSNNNFLENWKNFFEGGGKNSKDNTDIDNCDNDDDDDDIPAGQYRVASISVKSMKPGALRLFLMFYLLGMQNTPEANSWRAHQPTAPTSSKTSKSSSLNDVEQVQEPWNEHVVEFLYHDHSALLSVAMSERDQRITIARVGSKPSTAYMMHESTIVQGILNELEQMATDQQVPPDKRLLIVQPENAIDAARDALAFG